MPVLRGLNNYKKRSLPPAEDKGGKKKSKYVSGFNWKYDFVFSSELPVSKVDKRKKAHKKYYKKKGK